MADHLTTIHSEQTSEEGHRHWSPTSQTYAPADVLLHYLSNDWQLKPLAAVETFYYAGQRQVEVYYFTLVKEDRQLEMPVQANPIILRLIQEHNLTVLRVNAPHE